MIVRILTSYYSKYARHNKFAKKSKKRKSVDCGLSSEANNIGYCLIGTTGGGGPRYRMMYPTINHGGTNNNGNTKQRTTFRNDRDIVFALSI